MQNNNTIRKELGDLKYGKLKEIFSNITGFDFITDIFHDSYAVSSRSSFEYKGFSEDSIDIWKNFLVEYLEIICVDLETAEYSPELWCSEWNISSIDNQNLYEKKFTHSVEEYLEMIKNQSFRKREFGFILWENRELMNRKGITLLECIAYNFYYQFRFGKKLDIGNLVVCTGSRNSNNDVPLFYWNKGEPCISFIGTEESGDMK